MKIGDLVRVKDLAGYNAYMQGLVGHIGVITSFCAREKKVVWVGFIHGGYPKTRLSFQDLEVLSESR